MPVPSPYAVSLIVALLASIVGAWIWVILRLAFGLPVLPPNTPRIVPWGAGAVLATVLAWIVLNVSVPIAYFAAVRAHPAEAGNREKDKDKVKEKDQDKEKEKAGPAPVANPRANLSPGEMMTLSALQNAATLALVPLLLAATSGARPRDFGLTSSSDLDRQVGRGVLAYPLLAPIVFGVMLLSLRVWGRTAHPLEAAIAQDRSPGMVIILVLAGVVLAPAAEELIFRGVLLGWLTRIVLRARKPTPPDAMLDGIDLIPPGRDAHLMETVEIDSPEGSIEAEAEVEFEAAATAEQALHNPYAPPTAAIFAAGESKPAPLLGRPRAFLLLAANVAVSLIFAALHGAVWPTPIPIFFLSLGLGFLYQRTGGILAPTALHMTFNGVSTLMMFLSIGVAPAPKPAPKAINPVPPPAQTSPWPGPGPGPVAIAPEESQALSSSPFRLPPLGHPHG